MQLLDMSPLLFKHSNIAHHYSHHLIRQDDAPIISSNPNATLSLPSLSKHKKYGGVSINCVKSLFHKTRHILGVVIDVD